MGKTSIAKIAVGWSVVIATGLVGFVLARNSVVGNRKVCMETRQKIRDQAEREGAIEFERRQHEREQKHQQA